MKPYKIKGFCSAINSILQTAVQYFPAVCTKGYISLNRAEVNHAPGSYVYTMGILYRRISTWRTKQLVNMSRRYMATKPVRRVLNQELLEVIAF